MKRHKAGIKTQLEELWKYAETITKEELLDNDPTRFDELDPYQVKRR